MMKHLVIRNGKDMSNHFWTKFGNSNHSDCGEQECMPALPRLNGTGLMTQILSKNYKGTVY